MKKIIVYGSKEFGYVVKDIVSQCGHHFVGFIDDYSSDGGQVLGNFDQIVKSFSPESYEIAIAIGYSDLNARWLAYKKVISSGYRVPVLLHPKAYVRDKNAVSHGSIVMAGSIVDVNVKIGELAVLWPGAIVNHDSSVGANTFLSPNSTVCGSVIIGEGCFIGAGAVIVDHVHVPRGTFIKAGKIYSQK